MIVNRAYFMYYTTGFQFVYPGEGRFLRKLY